MYKMCMLFWEYVGDCFFWKFFLFHFKSIQIENFEAAFVTDKTPIDVTITILFNIIEFGIYFENIIQTLNQQVYI